MTLNDPKRRDASGLLFGGPPYVRSHRLTNSNQIWHGNPRGDIGNASGVSHASPSKWAGFRLTQICLDPPPPTNDQIQHGNTRGGEACFTGSRHCIFHKCVARFVRENWAFLSKYTVRVLIIILNARKERRKNNYILSNSCITQTNNTVNYCYCRLL